MAKAFKILPKNYLQDWGEFESWAAGTTSVPTGWLASTAATYSQELTNVKYGDFALAIVGGSLPFGGVYQTVPNGDDYAGRTFTFGVWAKCSASSPYIKIGDGVNESTQHLSQVNAFEEVKVTKQIDPSATQIRVDLVVPSGVTAYFDSGVLCEGQDLFTDFDSNIDISSWQPLLNLKTDQYEIANREGSFIPEYHLQARSLRIQGNVVGSDVQSCRNNFDNLMKSLLSWQKDEMRHLYLYDDRVIDVFLSTFDWQYINSLSMIKFNMMLLAPETINRSIGRYRTKQTISGTITDFNISYDGNCESKPKVAFVADQGGAISTCTLENLTTGQSMAYTGTVPTGVALNIDCNLGTVENSSIDKIGDFSGDFIALVRGTNYLRFTGSNCTINIDHFNRWY